MASFSETLMVVAIDFGTVYSGYAFSIRSDFRKDPTNIKANQVWSAHPGLLSDKTATCLLLTPSKQFKRFGYEAEDKYMKLAQRKKHQDWYFFRRFKMKLHGEEQVDEYMNIEDECGKPLPAIKVFSESIGYLMRHFLKKRDRLSIPIQDGEIMWVLTVPAIWNDSAKRFMRKAAVQAGIRSTNLIIALEPEAASIYFLHVNTENSESPESTLLRRGMKYMIIDLGGGTVDITVHKILSNGGMKEVCKASGGVWGGTAVDDGYIQLLMRIVGGPTIHQFRQEQMEDYIEMMREFEVRKRNIKFEDREDIAFRILYRLNEICNENNDETIHDITRSPNFPFKGDIKVRADKMVFKVRIVKHLFETVIDKIVDHVTDVIDENDLTNDLSLIVLVGGFSESSILQQKMESAFQTEHRSVIITKEPSLSVVKGAVMFGYNKHRIKSRILRYTYGTSPHAAFNPDRDPESKRFEIDGKYRIKLFKPFIEAGTNVLVGHSVTRQFSYSAWHFNADSVLQVFYSAYPDCKYPDDEGCHLLKQIPVGKILPEIPLDKRIIDVDFVFGDTEVEMIIREEDTDFVYNDKFEMNED